MKVVIVLMFAVIAAASVLPVDESVNQQVVAQIDIDAEEVAAELPNELVRDKRQYGGK